LVVSQQHQDSKFEIDYFLKDFKLSYQHGGDERIQETVKNVATSFITIPKDDLHFLIEALPDRELLTAL